jgi:hypothetical protein
MSLPPARLTHQVDPECIDDARRNCEPDDVLQVRVTIGVVVWLAAVTACSGRSLPARDRSTVTTPQDRRRTMTGIEIEGPRDKLRDLFGPNEIGDLEVARGFEDLGGGVFRARAIAYSDGALEELAARGLTVRVVKDDAEYERILEQEEEMMREAINDAENP